MIMIIDRRSRSVPAIKKFAADRVSCETAPCDPAVSLFDFFRRALRDADAGGAYHLCAAVMPHPTTGSRSQMEGHAGNEG